jgi:hypothetical protein
VPAENRVWLYDEKRISPPGDKTRENHEKVPRLAGEPRFPDRPRRDDELLAQQRVLGEQLLPRTDHVPDQPADHRGRTRDASGDCFHALCYPAREVMNPSNEGL